jgi:hypothetical protein
MSETSSDKPEAAAPSTPTPATKAPFWKRLLGKG